MQARNTITISPKGQIVLPKRIRTILNSNIISILVNDQNQILLTPVNELGGSLASYSKSDDIPFSDVREKAWKDSIAPKVNKPSNGQL